MQFFSNDAVSWLHEHHTVPLFSVWLSCFVGQGLLLSLRLMPGL